MEIITKCKSCGKIINDNVPICKECFLKELLWQYRNDPNVKEDIKYIKNTTGVFEEVEVIKGLSFKEEALKKIKEKYEG